MWGPSLRSPVGLAPGVGREDVGPYCCWWAPPRHPPVVPGVAV